MVLAEGVEVGTSAHAAVGVVPKFMNVEAMLAWRETLELDLDGGRSVALLSETNSSSDLGFTLENTNCSAAS